MANDFYNHSGYPATRAQGDSSSMRAQLAAIAAGFDKMPALSGNALRLVRVNAGGTALESVNAINAIAIGTTTPAAGAFTTLSSSGLATLASATITGAFAANGGATLGDAAGDALTVNSSSVTWANNPTHSGNHTFSGDVTINGNTTIGNASGDTLTFAPSAVTWSNNPTHSGNHSFSGTLAGASTARFGGTSYGSLGVRDGGAYGGAGPSSNVDGVVLEANGNTGLSILTPNTATVQIRFGDPENNAIGGIAYQHSSDAMSLSAGGSTAITIDQPNGTITIGGGYETVLADTTPSSNLSAGFRAIPSIGNTATATKAAVGKVYKNTGNLAINNSVFAADDVIAVYNNSASAITLNGTITTMRLAGTTTTGNRTIAARGWASIFFVSATECVVSGSGVS